MPYDLIIGYSRRDNECGQVTALKAQIESSFRAFAERDSQVFLAANWRLNAPPHANTTPRIAFLRHVIALIESQPDTPFLGQLKILMTGPELPVVGEAAVPWDIAYFIEFLKPILGEHHAEFLTALVAALNDRTKLSPLDRFPEWQNQPPIALDTPWPNR